MPPSLLPIDLRFICTSILPKTLQSLSPINSSGSYIPVTEFVQTSYRVNTGNTVDVTISLTGDVLPNTVSTVDYLTVNGTVINGIDYTGASGTLTWSPGDDPVKTIPIQTGGPLVLFKWLPEPTFYNSQGLNVYDPDKVTLEISFDGKSLEYTAASGITNVSYKPNFYSNRLEIIQPNQEIYYEFGFPLLEPQTSSSLTYHVYTKLNADDIVYSFVTIEFSYDEAINSYRTHINSPSNNNVEISLLVPIQSGVRFGFLINDNHGIKIHINGNWLNLNNLSEQFLNPDQIEFIYLTYNNVNEIFNGALFSTGSFDVLAPEYTGTFNNNNFSLTSFVNNEQIYNPGNIASATLVRSYANTGNFYIQLNNPINLSIFTPQTSVSVENNSLQGFFSFSNNFSLFPNLVTPNYARSNQVYPTLNLPYINATLNWDLNSANSGILLDYRFGSTNSLYTVDSINPTTLKLYKTNSPIYQLSNIRLSGLPVLGIADDVKELDLTIWPGFDLFNLANNNSNFFLLNNYVTNYKPFVITTNSDGSYNLKVKWRSYINYGEVIPKYILTDFYNDDPKGFMPRLLPLNIGINFTGSFILNILSYYDDSYDFIDVVSDPVNGAININPIIYYTLDGSEPNLNSAIYDANNPPILANQQIYIVKAYQVADGWQDSIVQTGIINTNKILKNLNGNPTISFIDNSYVPIPSIGFNSDNIYRGYEYFTFSFSNDENVNYNNPIIYYSIDGGINYKRYIDETRISLPLDWRIPTGNAGAPNISAYTVDQDGTVSNIKTKRIPFYYPNWNLEFQHHSSNVRNISNTISIDTASEDKTYFDCNDQLQTKLTSIDDFRYFEFKINTLTDADKTLQLNINNNILFRNGDVFNIANNSITQNTNLSWGEGDVIRILINYKDASVIFAINKQNGYYVAPGISPSEEDIIFIGFKDNSDNDENLTGSIIEYLFKTSEQYYPNSNIGFIYAANILPLDTST